MRVLLAICIAIAAAVCAGAQAADPFADVVPATTPADGTQQAQSSWLQNFLNDNFGFRKEILSEFDSNADGSGASRQSIGFEILKKFSTATSTVASFDFQARLVRRDGYNPVPNEMEGAAPQGWSFEYHNLYLDLYNVFGNVGRFNFRIGQSYVPFGLNLQTDTHGTLLQLSNGQNFGFDEDWSAGFWGAINKDFNYNAAYLIGSGHGLQFQGQHGLGAVRISLADKYSSKYGLEGGLSAIGGGRLVMPMTGSGAPDRVKTERLGIDGRYRHTAPKGLLTFTTELSGGRDSRAPLNTQLLQAEYLRGSRRWGIGTQFRRFFQDGLGANEAAIGEFTWYFRNDVANSNAHWIKINFERQLQGVLGLPHNIVTLQYYFYL